MTSAAEIGILPATAAGDPGLVASGGDWCGSPSRPAATGTPCDFVIYHKNLPG